MARARGPTSKRTMCRARRPHRQVRCTVDPTLTHPHLLQVREQRKEQAAHNVRMAKEAYGGASARLLPLVPFSYTPSGLVQKGSPDGIGRADSVSCASCADADGDEEDDDDESGSEDGSGSGSGSDSDADGGDERELAFEAPDGDLATVVVEPLSLSRSPTPEPLPPAPSTSSAPKPRPAQQTSMYKKRVKNTVQARPKMSREDKKARATGGKKVKKQMANRMKGTKGRAAK